MNKMVIKKERKKRAPRTLTRQFDEGALARQEKAQAPS